MSASTSLPPVTVISLTRSVGRRERVTRMMGQLGVDFDFFDAVDGRALSEADSGLYDAKVAQKIHGRGLTLGEIGNCLSHVYVWRDFLESQNTELLVLEDDAEIGTVLLEVLNARKNFRTGWEFVNFVSDTPSDVVGERIWDIYRMSTFREWSNRTACYLINRKGASRLLDHAYPIRFAADGLTGRSTETGLANFGVWPPVAGLSGEATTIEGRGELARGRPSLSAVLRHFIGSISVSRR